MVWPGYHLVFPPVSGSGAGLPPCEAHREKGLFFRKRPEAWRGPWSVAAAPRGSSAVRAAPAPASTRCNALSETQPAGQKAVVMPVHVRARALSRSNLSLLLVWPLAGSPSTSIQRPVARRFRPRAPTARVRKLPFSKPRGSVAVAQCQCCLVRGEGMTGLLVAAEIGMERGGMF